MRNTDPIFTTWEPGYSQRWGDEPMCIGHSLHNSPLFSQNALEQLIERYPREHYSLVHMGGQTDNRYWREGDIGGLSGKQVLEAIKNGRMWLNLRCTDMVDSRYADQLKEIFTELEERVPGLHTFDYTCGILISSPNAQVYYHSDLPGQSLWQIMGKKRVYVYPPEKPFLTSEQVEDIAVFEVEVDIPYREEFDKDAFVVDLEPGQMAHWQLNAPHRVENHDCLNVSMTVEYWTEPIRRSQIINMANGILRNQFGYQPKSRTMSGPVYWSKAVFQALMKRSGWLKTQRKIRRPIEFELDAAELGRIKDIAA